MIYPTPLFDFIRQQVLQKLSDKFVETIYNYCEENNIRYPLYTLYKEYALNPSPFCDFYKDWNNYEKAYIRERGIPPTITLSPVFFDWVSRSFRLNIYRLGSLEYKGDYSAIEDILLDKLRTREFVWELAKAGRNYYDHLDGKYYLSDEMEIEGIMDRMAWKLMDRSRIKIALQTHPVGFVGNITGEICDIIKQFQDIIYEMLDADSPTALREKFIDINTRLTRPYINIILAIIYEHYPNIWKQIADNAAFNLFTDFICDVIDFDQGGLAMILSDSFYHWFWHVFLPQHGGELEILDFDYVEELMRQKFGDLNYLDELADYLCGSD